MRGHTKDGREGRRTRDRREGKLREEKGKCANEGWKETRENGKNNDGRGKRTVERNGGGW